jgi:hypothetical protein
MTPTMGVRHRPRVGAGRLSDKGWVALSSGRLTLKFGVVGDDTNHGSRPADQPRMITLGNAAAALVAAVEVCDATTARQ